MGANSGGALSFSQVDERALAILIASTSNEIGDRAPATQALRDLSLTRTEEAWNVARVLFNRLPGANRQNIADSAVVLSHKLMQSDGGVLNLLNALGRRAPQDPQPGPQKVQAPTQADPQDQKPQRNGALRERVWR